jgi:hypothetical protein
LRLALLVRPARSSEVNWRHTSQFSCIHVRITLHFLQYVYQHASAVAYPIPR